jgi:hypothetical protein
MKAVAEMTEPDKEFDEAAARAEADDRMPGGPVAWFGWDSIEQPTADGGVIACGARDGNTYFVNVTRRPWRVASVIPKSLYAWSTDGRRMAFLSGDWSSIDIYPANKETGADLNVPPTCTIPLREGENRINAAAFSPDDTMLAIVPERTAGHESAVHVFMLNDAEAPVMEPCPVPAQAPARQTRRRRQY